ncbi:MAG: DUF4980 domain-containing protein, partial [Muribaculaceae bacterium]|nr:DUF4980 domain-containing protein [Muribaculaceae bacterium]
MKKIFYAMIALAAPALASAAAAVAESGVKIEHLGTNNTLVRVTGEGKYLLLPVQESNDDATLNILVDGRLDRTLKVRLAKSRTDYTVPLDLER